MATTEKPLACSECGREPHAGENADDRWRAYSDGAGELVVFCPGVRRARLRVDRPRSLYQDPSWAGSLGEREVGK